MDLFSLVKKYFPKAPVYDREEDMELIRGIAARCVMPYHSTVYTNQKLGKKGILTTEEIAKSREEIISYRF